MSSGGNGSGPGGHPGVEISELTGDKVADKATLEAGLKALESAKGVELYFYNAGGKSFAVFAHDYKK